MAPAVETVGKACLSVQVMNRAVLAGQLLAHVLMSGAHGGRPVTLIGFSMGARCCYLLPFCLLTTIACTLQARASHDDSHLILIGQPDAALGMPEHQKLRIGNLCGMATENAAPGLHDCAAAR